MGKIRRKYTDDCKATAVERLYETGATQGSVAKELGIMGTLLQTWRLVEEIENSHKSSIFYNTGGETMANKLAFVTAHKILYARFKKCLLLVMTRR